MRATPRGLSIKERRAMWMGAWVAWTHDGRRVIPSARDATRMAFGVEPTCEARP